MRKLIFVLVLLAAGVVAVGFYRGWFSFETSSDPANGRDGARIEIDRNKIGQDIDQVKQKVGTGSTGETGAKPEGRQP
jgi:hypothetical protein